MTKTRMRPGHCYDNCFNWAYDNEAKYKSLRIVHGYPSDPFTFGHAWLEWGGWVFDPTKGERMRKGEYYRLKGIDPAHCRRYTLRELAGLMIQNKHFGPFHDEPARTVGVVA